MTTELPDTLIEAAAAWHARLRQPMPGLEVRTAFKTWIGSDPRHFAAFAEVERLFGVLDKPVTQVMAEETSRARAVVRPRWTAALAAGIGAVVLSATLWLNGGGYDRLRSDDATGIGETRILRLADGSELTLNTDTAITHQVEGDSRRVDLLRGEAYFSVAPDPAKPFFVRTGNGTIRVVGTRFNVRTAAAGTTVSVEQGIVEVTSDDGASLRLTRGQQAAIEDGIVTAPRMFDAKEIAAWRSGQLVFFRAPLRDVVAELNRYRRDRIVVAAHELQEQPLSGVFSTDRTADAIGVIEQTLGVKSVSVAGVVTILY